MHLYLFECLANCNAVAFKALVGTFCLSINVVFFLFVQGYFSHTHTACNDIGGTDNRDIFRTSCRMYSCKYMSVRSKGHKYYSTRSSIKHGPVKLIYHTISCCCDRLVSCRYLRTSNWINNSRDPHCKFESAILAPKCKTAPFLDGSILDYEGANLKFGSKQTHWTSNWPL